MAERRIRTAGRPSYSRPVPPRVRTKRKLKIEFSLVQRRSAILIAVGVVLLLAMNQVFAIRTIDVVPIDPRISQESEKIIGANLTLRNLFTFDSASFRSKLLAADPTLKDVVVHRQWPNHIRLVVAQREPLIGWSSGNQAFQLDSEGVVIGPMPTGSKLPLVFDDSNLPVTVGQSVVSNRFVSFVEGINKQIPNLSIVVQKYEIKDTTYDLYATTNKGFQLILDTSRGAGDEIVDLRIVLANLKQTNKVPAQYIDLRIAGRAYFK
jgi:cell division septal protein FtsQ